MTCPKCRSDDRAHRCLVTTLRPDGSGLDTRECPDGWHDGWHDAPPASVEPVAVWRTVGGEWRKTGNGAFTCHEYRALPVAAFTALMARVERAQAALRYVVAMFTPPHRVVCGDDPRDARHCLEGLEAEIDAVVESARTALRAGGG